MHVAVGGAAVNLHPLPIRVLRIANCSGASVDSADSSRIEGRVPMIHATTPVGPIVAFQAATYLPTSSGVEAKRGSSRGERRCACQWPRRLRRSHINTVAINEGENGGSEGKVERRGSKLC